MLISNREWIIVSHPDDINYQYWVIVNFMNIYYDIPMEPDGIDN